jgi:hypothetical protein
MNPLARYMRSSKQKKEHGMPLFSPDKRSLSFRIVLTSTDFAEGLRRFRDIAEPFTGNMENITDSFEVKSCILERAEALWPTLTFAPRITTTFQILLVPSARHLVSTWRIARSVMDGLLFVPGDHLSEHWWLFERLCRDFQKERKTSAPIPMRIIMADLPGHDVLECSKMFSCSDFFDCKCIAVKQHDRPSAFRAFLELAEFTVSQSRKSCKAGFATPAGR